MKLFITYANIRQPNNLTIVLTDAQYALIDAETTIETTIFSDPSVIVT
jgi:hypothetical protein